MTDFLFLGELSL